MPFPSPMHEVRSESEVTQSCPTLHDPMDCSLPGSSIHGIFQERVLEWVAIAFSRLYAMLRNLDFILKALEKNIFSDYKSCTKLYKGVWKIQKNIRKKFFFSFFFAVPQSMQDLSSPTRYQTHVPAWKLRVLTTG